MNGCCFPYCMDLYNDFMTTIFYLHTCLLMPLDAIPNAVTIAIIDCTRMYHHIPLHYIQNKILKSPGNMKKEGATGSAFAKLRTVKNFSIPK